MINKMVIIASWCVQVTPNDRPSMRKIIEMLENDVKLLQMPPRPYQLPFETSTDDQSYQSTEDRSHDGSTGETSTLLYHPNEISATV
ncbi:hypothetical protein GQ457_06G023540 [Hibiscus cannabinus]